MFALSSRRAPSGPGLDPSADTVTGRLLRSCGARRHAPEPSLKENHRCRSRTWTTSRRSIRFFRIIEEGLDGLVDGAHFFEILAEDVVFDYVITIPGYPRHVEGRYAVAELYRPYGDAFFLDRCHDLAVHHDRDTGVVVLEYASQGRIVATGAPYRNRYISVLTVADRKVTRWRDYLDPIAVFDAAGWPPRGN